MNNRSSKRRRRRPPQAYHATYESSVEERLLQQAIANSKLDQRRPVDGKLDIAYGPTFFPTEEEFEGNPLHYIEKIRPVAEKFGICKIVPPKGFKPPFSVDMNNSKKFSTKEQLLWRLQEGVSFGDGDEYTAQEYSSMASGKAKAYKAKYYPEHDLLSRNIPPAPHKVPSSPLPDVSKSDQDSEADKKMTPENLERDYWDMVETHNHEVAVEYGNDVNTDEFGSGFPLSERGRSKYGTLDPEKAKLPEPKFGDKDFYKETWWNLNNISSAPDSVLRHVRVGINGINVPWMYHGCMFSTFCWHNEDNYLYSINYHHKGAPKQWYGVPGTKSDSDGLEKVFKSFLSIKMRDVPDLLHHITTMFSPRLLQNSAVAVCKILQHPGEFLVTFPRAFHGGFSLGPNVGEAVNFATHDWIAYGSDANERYRSYARPAVFSHDRLTFTMANHLAEQKSFATCSLLLKELTRVVKEELDLRERLIGTGVRDVSELITLPRNRLDQLDEESADYDDKRLCHTCKHVCFFSAVACECSQTKVSCLRHSHFMCRCTPDNRYLMVWCGEEEMNDTVEKVSNHCISLKEEQDDKSMENTKSLETSRTASAKTAFFAPGVVEDMELHKYDGIDLEPIRADPNFKPEIRANDGKPNVMRSGTSMAGGGRAAITPSSLVESTVTKKPEVSDGPDTDEDAVSFEDTTAQPLTVNENSSIVSTDIMSIL